MKTINEFLNKKTSILIDNKLLHTSIFLIFGIDDEDPWSYDYNKLKYICELYNYPHHYEYIKLNIEILMKRIIDENLDYDLGQDIKYQYAEEIFGQKIIRFD